MPFRTRTVPRCGQHLPVENGRHGQALAHSFCILHSAFSILLVVYVNADGGFRLMTPDERGQVREMRDGP
jgi:hypothetical protein